MLLPDSWLFAPLRGLMWIFREVQAAAEEEQQASRRQLLQSLSELHGQLERGELDELAFSTREKDVLDQLDAMQEGRSITQ